MSSRLWHLELDLAELWWKQNLQESIAPLDNVLLSQSRPTGAYVPESGLSTTETISPTDPTVIDLSMN